ncbi:oligosaccharide flippase family protein [Ampullimonas aquatilis]|uniref:oligosaccharide flippase family protein n=1 Tax=Ampullimonas aquatilis TaxID=1341549 RepID=UPI003C77AC0F
MSAQPEIQRDSLRANVIALYLLQAANYIIPFLTLPYLVRMLGADRYGLLAFSQSLIMFFVVFVDAGFYSYAVRTISVSRQDPVRVAQIFWATQTIKAVLAVFGLIGLIATIVLVDSWRADWPVYAWQSLMILGTISFPIWFFQGIERMRYTAVFNVGSRIVVSACLFIFVKGPEDLMYAAGLQASSTLISGILSHALVLRKEVLWLRPSMAAIKEVFHGGKELFASNFLTAASQNSNIFLLGLFSSHEVVGAYAAIEKLIRAIASIFSPINAAIYPRVAQAYDRSHRLGIKLANKLLLLLGSGALLGGLMLALLADFILSLVFGQKLLPYDYILIGMTCWMVCNMIHEILGAQHMLAAGHFSAYSRITIIGVLVQLSLMLVLTSQFNVKGMMVAVTLGELLQLVFIWLFLKRQNNSQAV